LPLFVPFFWLKISLQRATPPLKGQGAGFQSNGNGDRPPISPLFGAQSDPMTGQIEGGGGMSKSSIPISRFLFGGSTLKGRREATPELPIPRKQYPRSRFRAFRTDPQPSNLRKSAIEGPHRSTLIVGEGIKSQENVVHSHRWCLFYFDLKTLICKILPNFIPISSIVALYHSIPSPHVHDINVIPFPQANSPKNPILI